MIAKREDQSLPVHVEAKQFELRLVKSESVKLAKYVLASSPRDFSEGALLITSAGRRR